MKQSMRLSNFCLLILLLIGFNGLKGVEDSYAKVDTLHSGVDNYVYTASRSTEEMLANKPSVQDWKNSTNWQATSGACLGKGTFLVVGPDSKLAVFNSSTGANFHGFGNMISAKKVASAPDLKNPGSSICLAIGDNDGVYYYRGPVTEEKKTEQWKGLHANGGYVSAKEVAVNANGEMLWISSDGYLYFSPGVTVSDAAYTLGAYKIPQIEQNRAMAIAAAVNHFAVISVDKVIYGFAGDPKSDGSGIKLKEIRFTGDPKSDGSGQTSQEIKRPATQIAIASNGHMMIVSGDRIIYYSMGLDVNNNARWIKEPGTNAGFVAINSDWIVRDPTTADVVKHPITIISANYGGYSSFNGKDFVSRLQNVIGNNTTYTLPNKDYPSAGCFNAIFGDPTPGKLKTLTVTWKSLDGVEHTVRAREGERITFGIGDVVVPVVKHPITIISANYDGYSSFNGKDFFSRLQNVIGNNTTYTLPNKDYPKDFVSRLQNVIGNNITYTLPNKDYPSAGCFNAIFGDPTPGKLKTLTVTWKSLDGVEHTVAAREGERITFAIDDVVVPSVVTVIPGGFISEKGFAFSVASGCGLFGDPIAFKIDDKGNIQVYDAYAFGENPWVGMPNPTVPAKLLTASSDGGLIAVLADGSIKEFDFNGNSTPITAASAVVSISSTSVSPALASAGTVPPASTSRRAARRGRGRGNVSTPTPSTTTPAVVAASTTSDTAKVAEMMPMKPDIIETVKTKNTWVAVPGDLAKITDIALGGEQYLVAVGGDDKSIYRHTGTAWEKVSPVATNATGVAVGSDGVIFALNEAGVPLYINNGRWTAISSPVKFVSISAGNKTNVIAIAKGDYSLWKLNVSTNSFEVMKDTAGKKSSGIKFASINAFGMIFLCDFAGNLWHNDDAGNPNAVNTSRTTVQNMLAAPVTDAIVTTEVVPVVTTSTGTTPATSADTNVTTQDANVTTQTGTSTVEVTAGTTSTSDATTGRRTRRSRSTTGRATTPSTTTAGATTTNVVNTQTAVSTTDSTVTSETTKKPTRKTPTRTAQRKTARVR